jgi:hypothetical protein
MRKREKSLAVGFTHVAVGQSSINPGTDSVSCTLRRDVLDSAGSFSGLEKFLLCFQEKPSSRRRRLLHSRGLSQ